MNTQTHTQTEAVILEMLTENTGRSFLDSGDAYGRKWEQNQALGIDGLAQVPAVTFSDGRPVLSMFAFLREHLTYSPVLDSAWQEFDASRPDASWRENLAEWLDAFGLIPDGDAYGSGNYFELNTYENEYSLLSQVVQFHAFNMNKKSFIALQIHGGCDVRGGYTKPRIFEFDFESFWLGMESATVKCHSCKLELEFCVDQLEIETGNMENEEHAEKMEALDARELREWFEAYETQNTCPNCGNSGTIAGVN